MDVDVDKLWRNKCGNAEKYTQDKSYVGSVDKHRLTEEIYLLLWHWLLCQLLDYYNLLVVFKLHLFRTLGTAYWALIKFAMHASVAVAAEPVFLCCHRRAWLRMCNVATCAVARADAILVAVVEAHIFTSLLNGALDTHLLHVWVGRNLRLNVVTFDKVC